MSDAFLPQAIGIIKEAIALDDARRFAEAREKYKEGLERLLVVGQTD